MMDLLSFIRKSSEQPMILAEQPLVCFRGQKEYPVSFFAHVVAWLKRQQMMVTTIDLENADADDVVRAQLTTSFLGMRGIYWLRNIADLPEKRAKHWIMFISQYAGPHTLMFYIDAETKCSFECSLSIEVPDMLPRSAIDTLLLWESGGQQGMYSSVKRLIAACPDQLSLDSMYSIMHYATLLGERQQEFVQLWLDKIVVNEQSLFTLSQYFFSRKATSFFSYWRTIGVEYPDVFWVAYWSDQIWRAFMYTLLMREKRIAEAKRIGFRLPFSFINNDWRSWRPEDLQRAHGQLYELDFALKNGGNNLGIDLFYSAFLSPIA